MTDCIVGLKFSLYGQTFFFTSPDPSIQKGDRVFAETEHGLGLGDVVCVRTEAPKCLDIEELRPIERKVEEADLPSIEEHDTLQHAAFHFCAECIRNRELDMKLVDVEMLFNKSKILFYFTAPTRIDFRELVKDLVCEYHTRIELRQIGVRHETQMLGAIGSCGMVCCCRRFLKKFMPVTIKMAKEQNLFLNPTKISGICGRLLCCLSYEQENYDVFHKACPKIGKRYKTSIGLVRVLRGNMFQNSITVLDEHGAEHEYKLDEWQQIQIKRNTPPAQTQKEKPTTNQSQKSPEKKALLPEALTEMASDGAFFVVSADETSEEDENLNNNKE